MYVPASQLTQKTPEKNIGNIDLPTCTPLTNTLHNGSN